jgi:hypothetical protein
MLHELFDEIVSYLFSLDKYLKDLKEKRTEILGLIGITVSFLSYLILESNIEVGFWLGIINLTVGVIYALLIVGISWVLSKSTYLHPAQVFWFMFSVGIIDSLVIFSISLKFLVPQLFFLIVIAVVITKIFYLTKGLSTIFNIPKTTSLVILASPYVLTLIIILVGLVVTYFSLYKELRELINSI